MGQLISEKILKDQRGFLKQDQVRALVNENRLMPVLVRCGGGRFSCPAQDVEHFISCIGKSGMDYVRDVSIK